jgi:hypothetical protein
MTARVVPGEIEKSRRPGRGGVVRYRPKPPSVRMFFRLLQMPLNGCQFDRSQNKVILPFGAMRWSTMSAVRPQPHAHRGEPSEARNALDSLYHSLVYPRAWRLPRRWSLAACRSTLRFVWHRHGVPFGTEKPQGHILLAMGNGAAEAAPLLLRKPRSSASQSGQDW